MLRIELTDTTILHMSGRLTAGCDEEVKVLLAGHPLLSPIVVDLSEVTYVDRDGEELLRWLGQNGALFRADTSYLRDVCERLHLDHE